MAEEMKGVPCAVCDRTATGFMLVRSQVLRDGDGALIIEGSSDRCAWAFCEEHAKKMEDNRIDLSGLREDGAST